MTQVPVDKLKDWFIQEKRSFPWRESPTPYAVWISEIMLQQTRANVVIDYFTRWMRLFPSIDSVAKAPIEELIKAWEGLGYYSRVRNIQKAARILSEKKEDLPSSLADLLQMPGIGSYTAGAIASFAFHQKAAAVDGNVARVISRYYGLEGEVKKTTLEEKTLSFLPEEESWVVMEALIELGATLCQKNPKCTGCPLQEGCKAHLQDKTDIIPAKKKKQETIYLHKQVVIIIHEEEVLVEKKKEGQVLGGLMEFPSFPYEQESTSKYFSFPMEWMEDLPEEKQSFTKYQLDLFPSVFKALEKKKIEGYSWIKIDSLVSLTFSSGHKRILQSFLETCNLLT
ncbi:MAG: A/G-specific adenine glycosylase [Verrucomicrobia bacterium]|nr:A/G-specific adenine glycosylase [Verrucomicrobiota bacterium]